jgi:hypothetical protein
MRHPIIPCAKAKYHLGINNFAPLVDIKIAENMQPSKIAAGKWPKSKKNESKMLSKSNTTQFLGALSRVKLKGINLFQIILDGEIYNCLFV